MHIFTRDDCVQTEEKINLSGKVVVYSEINPENSHSNQLFLCMEENSEAGNIHSAYVKLASLSNGEYHLGRRENIVGILRPKLLPDEAKLQLSQIRPGGAMDLGTHEPQYSGYSFLEDGRYAAGVWLHSTKEVKDYIEMQAPYQHRLLICDRDDLAVMEVVDGQVVFPAQEDIKACLNGQQNQQKGGGMEMK